jgi:hypothetical protein
VLGNGKYCDNWDEGDGSGISRGESKDACRLEYEDERDVKCGRFGGCGCSIGSKQNKEKKVSVSLSGCKLFWDARHHGGNTVNGVSNVKGNVSHVSMAAAIPRRMPKMDGLQIAVIAHRTLFSSNATP